ncbi:hypothetical protein EXE30_06600 [Acinetobacter halotolerans]|uniref:Immunity MXAN-0049 protein domain-containing protein n=1 Tax=Acinetobacter halotolerans TaxID=1752076 RepID=A0A4Q6XHH7_9GAMM|nr:DUF1629 domain-containing protein [Acinetobacter halotolerans]RZF53639.1 hypothetical protein EXE30_06600 [Acinetobacter halotolerans]
MDYYEIKADFYDFSNQYFITEIDGFNNPRAQLDWDEFLFEYLSNKQKQYVATIESGLEEVDFTTTFYGFCVVSEKFANLLVLEKISDCLFIPLIFNKQLSQKFYLLIDSLRYDCVDEKNSDFQKFLENDPVRPDFAGRYRAFFKLIIDASKTDNSDLFRLENEDSTVIVSQRIKDIYDSNHFTGASFTKVTLDRL